MNSPPAESYNQLTSQIIAAAIEVHRRLGPGLLESTYEACLVYELSKRGLKAEKQVALPVVYDSVKLEAGYRIDILINDSILLELKALEALAPIHEAQLITYLKLSGKKVGLLINFNLVRLVDGIVRRAN